MFLHVALFCDIVKVSDLLSTTVPINKWLDIIDFTHTSQYFQLSFVIPKPQSTPDIQAIFNPFDPLVIYIICFVNKLITG